MNWVDDYITLLKTNNNIEAQELKLKNLPSTLFKFRGLNNYTFDCFYMQSVWMSAPDLLNDPFECTLAYIEREFMFNFLTSTKFKVEFEKNYGTNIMDEEIKNILESSDLSSSFEKLCKSKGLKKYAENGSAERESLFRKFADSFKDKLRVTSFTERNDSILMWSHYADNHKGICIEYDFTGDYQICSLIEPTIYSDTIPQFPKYTEFGTKTNVLRIAGITKAKDWQYEKEWRLVFSPREGTEMFGHLKVPIPTAIYLGARFNQNASEHITWLKNYSSFYNIPLYQMEAHKSEYRITKST